METWGARVLCGVCSVSRTDELTRQCDRLTNETDQLLKGVDTVDTQIGQLSEAASDRAIQISILCQSQKRLMCQRRAFARQLFWAELHPAEIASRLRHWGRSRRQQARSTRS